MHDVHVCAQQSSNAGVELNIPVWGGDLPTLAVEIFFLWTTLSLVRPESAVCIANYWGTDGKDQRKWTTFLVHPTNSASAILSKRNKKHRLKSEFIALNLRIHLLWHSCTGNAANNLVKAHNGERASREEDITCAQIAFLVWSTLTKFAKIFPVYNVTWLPLDPSKTECLCSCDLRWPCPLQRVESR